jgi:DNA modification methylase
MKLRRPFNITKKDPYTDIWRFKPVAYYPGKHPAAKPLALMEHIIKSSTRPGDLVLDSFMGHGSTGRAALLLGRKFIGIEKDLDSFQQACRVIESAHNDVPLFHTNSRPPCWPASKAGLLLP